MRANGGGSGERRASLAPASRPQQEEPEECAVTVAVRVRPLSAQERASDASCCVQVDEGAAQIVLLPAPDAPPSAEPHCFAFDFVWDSAHVQDDQPRVYQVLGARVVTAAFRGYNSCVFAYGQTGSGKTYTMLGPEVGSEQHAGLIPRLCREVFARVGDDAGPSGGSSAVKVEASYLEIYQEQVRCLLNPGKMGLRVREHPLLGPYVQDLTRLVVGSASDALRLLEDGGRVRHVAETKMNDRSSRSHAIFTLTVTQTTVVEEVESEIVSRINLVDLAGSERAKATGATGERLAEGAQINKSLTALGLVISALAEGSKRRTSQKSGKLHVPYRDSTLTWLLKDNLGGNSQTTMVSTVSPADSSREETLSTLRYADRAKAIVTRVRVNEDATVRLIRELRAEIASYQERLAAYEASGCVPPSPTTPVLATPRSPCSEELRSPAPAAPEPTEHAAALRQRLQLAERIMQEAGRTWAERVEQSQTEELARGAAMAALGLTVRRDTSRPCLVNLLHDEGDWLAHYLPREGAAELRMRDGLITFDPEAHSSPLDCSLRAAHPHGAELRTEQPNCPVRIWRRPSGSDGGRAEPEQLAAGAVVPLSHGDEIGLAHHRLRFSDPRAPPGLRTAARRGVGVATEGPPTEPAGEAEAPRPAPPPIPPLDLQDTAPFSWTPADTQRTAQSDDPGRAPGAAMRHPVVLLGAPGRGKTSVLHCLTKAASFWERRSLPSVAPTLGVQLSERRVRVSGASAVDLVFVDHGAGCAPLLPFVVPNGRCTAVLVGDLSGGREALRGLVDEAVVLCPSAQLLLVFPFRDRLAESDKELTAFAASAATLAMQRARELSTGQAPVLLGAFVVSCKTRSILCAGKRSVSQFAELAHLIAAVALCRADAGSMLPSAAEVELEALVAAQRAQGEWSLSSAEWKQLAGQVEERWGRGGAALSEVSGRMHRELRLLHFADSPRLRGRVFLDPQWVCSTLAAPLACAAERAEHTNGHGFGEVLRRDPGRALARGILGAPAAAALYRQPPGGRERKLGRCLELLIAFDLAFPVYTPEEGRRVLATDPPSPPAGGGHVYLVPELFTGAPPELLLRVMPEALAPGQRRAWELHPQLPPGLFARLLVRVQRCVQRLYFGPVPALHTTQGVEGASFWRTGAWLQHTGGTRGLLWALESTAEVHLCACGREARAVADGVSAALRSLAAGCGGLRLTELLSPADIGAPAAPPGASPRQRRLAALQRLMAEPSALGPAAAAAVQALTAGWAAAGARPGAKGGGGGFVDCAFCGEPFSELCLQCPLCGEEKPSPGGGRRQGAQEGSAAARQPAADGAAVLRQLAAEQPAPAAAEGTTHRGGPAAEEEAARLDELCLALCGDSAPLPERPAA
eukprot:TRINITY_DN4288_c0_g1_i1.p1 TRINITY_DN4288_c0_g1~~TRINITY_DN4288_c0_g1_i1.p1  ORF type:complete len:1374 (+),score=344.83 TRINITY_DN4288_c0_g1_i1:82-4203(+)